MGHGGCDRRRRNKLGDKRDLLYRIRVFKLVKLLYYNIRTKIEASEYENDKDYLEQEKYESAIRQFTKALEENPADGNAYYELGAFLLRERNIAKAIERFGKGIEVSPENEKNYVGIGAAYQMTGKMEEAFKWIKKGLEINPANLNFPYQLCLFYNYLGNYEEQIKWAKEGIKLNPNAENFYLFFQSIPPELAAGKEDEIKEFLKLYPKTQSQYYLDLLEPCFYGDFHEISRRYQENESKILDWVKSDLEKIIDICREEGIDLIIQNYPLRRHGNFWTRK